MALFYVREDETGELASIKGLCLVVKYRRHHELHCIRCMFSLIEANTEALQSIRTIKKHVTETHP